MARRRTARSWRSAWFATTLLWACAAPPPKAPPAPAQPSFADLFNRLSEPGGYFDSDNLISNETSYLHALDDLRTRQITGGAYIGVGPDQSFSYIAEIKPEVAFMIDIRRDNMLQHLMFRSLFQRSRNRMEYLTGLIGARVENLGSWTGKPIEQILAVLDTAQRTPAEFTRWSTLVIQDALATGITLTADDLATLQRFHLEFHEFGLNIRYSSKNRPPRLTYPTLRQLILERDRTGALASYLATEERWRIVQDMQKRDRILLVTGDLAGAHALRAIGTYVTQRGLQVSAFYTSNVEQYLFQYGSFERFAGNTVLLPFASNGVIIRSFFNRGGGHPAAIPGHISVQIVQPAAEFLARTSSGGYASYFELTGILN
jgi:hypothetical protein